MAREKAFMVVKDGEEYIFAVPDFMAHKIIQVLGQMYQSKQVEYFEGLYPHD